MGKASEFDKEMEGRVLRPGELWPVRPEVRVRAETPSVQVSNSGELHELTDRAKIEGAVVARGEDGTPRAVVLSPERYAELAGCMIESEEQFEATEGALRPNPDSLRELLIEQTDPTAEWRHGSRIWREGH